PVVLRHRSGARLRGRRRQRARAHVGSGQRSQRVGLGRLPAVMEVIFGVLGLLFLFADVRTFASTFQQTFFGAPNTTLAIMATATFATSFLGLAVGWRLGPTRALGISAALFGATTFLAVASRN